jgi:hypothetical protein
VALAVQQSTFFVAKVVPAFAVSQTCVVAVAQATAVGPHLVSSSLQQFALHEDASVADVLQYKPVSGHFSLYPGEQVTPVAEHSALAVQHTVFLFVDVAAVPSLAVSL